MLRGLQWHMQGGDSFVAIRARRRPYPSRGLCVRSEVGSEGQLPEIRDHDSRHTRLATLLAATTEERLDGGRSRLGRLCAVAVSELGVSGAGITVMAQTGDGLAGARDQIWATDDVARQLENLQLTTGQGPCLDACADGTPVLVADLGAEPSRWPGFGGEAIAAGVAAVFSLPLQVGAVRLGSLDLHRCTVGALTRDQYGDALALAGLATELLLELTAGSPGAGDAGAVPATYDDEPMIGAEHLGWLPTVHAEVHQASGMVSARESIGVDAALLRIRGYAFARSQSIVQVARRILDRTLTLDADDEQEGPTGPIVETDR